MEAAKLDEFDITHAPTIGAMYEGLSADLLARAFPPELGLRVASGFVENDQEMSGQIDCMLVAGEGRPIPYTDGHVWHVKDVVAVFEIKKTLYGDDMKDAFQHLAKVKDLERDYTRSLRGNYSLDMSDAVNAYGQITGKAAPADDELGQMERADYILFATMLHERLHSIRIVLGYGGFQTEGGFRTSMEDFIVANIDNSGMGVGTFPHLISTGKYSLLKTNGMPYTVIGEPGWWLFYCSTKANPIWLILEFIWTRLSSGFGVRDLWGEDLEVENIHAFLSARLRVADDGRSGWELMHHTRKEKDLAAAPATHPWTPTTLTYEQAVVIAQLCAGNEVDFSDEDSMAWAHKEAVDLYELREGLQHTGLVAFAGDVPELLTDLCKVTALPDGRWVAADDSTGRFTRWLEALAKTSADSPQSLDVEGPDGSSTGSPTSQGI
jgi:hypothetical protein